MSICSRGTHTTTRKTLGGAPSLEWGLVLSRPGGTMGSTPERVHMKRGKQRGIQRSSATSPFALLSMFYIVCVFFMVCCVMWNQTGEYTSGRVHTAADHGHKRSVRKLNGEKKNASCSFLKTHSYHASINKALQNNNSSWYRFRLIIHPTLISMTSSETQNRRRLVHIVLVK